ncbi:MAG: YggS family pyridoxal phosphate-dependent enzyme [bacterium]
MSTIQKKVNTLKKEIEKHSQKEITIIAASKYASIEQIITAQKAGISQFGESKIQDAIPKIEALKQLDLTWHFIGHLQKNKVKKAIQYFSHIQSVDSLKLLEVVQKECRKANKKMNIFLQININNAPQKYGFCPENIIITPLNPSDYPNVLINGIMVMLPNSDNDEIRKQYSQKANTIYKKMKKKIKTINYLSMGMSQDYKITIKHGANMIRIGSSLFKEDKYDN